MGSIGRFRRKVERRLRCKDEALGLLWMMHFGDLEPCKATCKDCSDFRIGVCKGGRDPWECIQEKEVQGVEFFWG